MFLDALIVAPDVDNGRLFCNAIGWLAGDRSHLVRA
jgi:hypothetical protein